MRRPERVESGGRRVDRAVTARSDARRGGDQSIPRPADARTGPPAPWEGVPPGERRLTMEQVARRLRELPPPVHAAPRVPDASAAAVLIPLFEQDGETRVILTRRPDTMPTHRGEVAFPGGRHDPRSDPDLESTALRETYEEVGIDPAAVDVVAELDGLATVGSRFTIAPFVGLLDGRPRLRPDHYEVVRVFDVALSELLDPAVFRREIWGARPGFAEPFEVHFFETAGETIWGATARIMSGLLAHLVGGR